MSSEKVWSQYEAVIKIWEQNPLTGAKVNPSTPLIIPRLVRGLALNATEETEDIRQPGQDPEDHHGHRELELVIDQFFQEKDEQFITGPLFDRLSTITGPPQLNKRFIIELLYSNKREHLIDDLLEFKQVYPKLPQMNASETPAGLTSYSIGFRILEFA